MKVKDLIDQLSNLDPNLDVAAKDDYAWAVTRVKVERAFNVVYLE